MSRTAEKEGSVNRTKKYALIVAASVALAALIWIVDSPRVDAESSTESATTQSSQSQAKGQELADSIMAQWMRKNPDRADNWIEEEKERHTILPPADNSDVVVGGEGEGNTYGQPTARDVLMWERETEKLVVEGSRIFHSSDLLGSTVAVSCDMCHPNAANTHPETYPKFQVQMGRVALLRDMINWCIEQPVRGPRLAPDDPAMRALEAYIYAQRKGTLLNYGKN
jgi:thiosulfate dehydrogenase